MPEKPSNACCEPSQRLVGFPSPEWVQGLTWGISITPTAEVMYVNRKETPRKILLHELGLSGSERLKGTLGLPPLRCSVKWSLDNHLRRNPKIGILKGITLSIADTVIRS